MSKQCTCLPRVAPVQHSRAAQCALFGFPTPSAFPAARTHTHVRLLGPCFKTGRSVHSCASHSAPLFAGCVGCPRVGRPESGEAALWATCCALGVLVSICVDSGACPSAFASRRFTGAAALLVGSSGLDPLCAALPVFARRRLRRATHERTHTPRGRHVALTRYMAARAPPIASSHTISSTWHSLFKVLFIFPSRYLFAIGLSPVFSLGWNLPPAWSCIPKQLDSSETRRTPRPPSHARGSHPPWHRLPTDLCSARRLGVAPLPHTPPRRRAGRFRG